MEAMIFLDFFSKKPEMRLPSGRRQYRTFLGCWFSLVFLACIAVLGVLFLYDFIDEDLRRYSIDKKLHRDAIAPTDEQQVMKLAFGLIDNADPSAKLLPEIGTLNAYVRTWDLTDPDKAQATYELLTSSQCGYEELGLIEPSGTSSTASSTDDTSSDDADDEDRDFSDVADALDEASGDLDDLIDAAGDLGDLTDAISDIDAVLDGLEDVSDLSDLSDLVNGLNRRRLDDHEEDVFYQPDDESSRNMLARFQNSF